MITVNIASVPEREKQLYHTVFSLLDQVDKINICLNNYKHNPFDFMDRNSHKINVRFEDNSLGDAGRYLFVEETEGWYFTVDDDLIFNSYYIEDTILRMTENNYKIATYHGRTFNSYPIDSYHQTPCLKYRCLGDVEQDVKVDIGGTGVSCFHTKDFKPPIEIFTDKNMADVLVSCYAKEQGLDVNVLSHKSDYFRYQEVPNTIYEQRVNNCERETYLVNKCFNK